MSHDIIGKPAKIVVQTEYVMYGRVLEITPTHHIIQSSKGTIKEVLNERVVLVDIKEVEKFDSPIE